jgi:PhzF family phenazine biosynthesis protein
MRQWMVDAFASGPFRGNPACVVEPFGGWPDDGWMQALAMENNQAETAFLLKTSDDARFGLRWFTPTTEVPLCGHATLASSHVLLGELGVKAPAITFDTRSGPLTVSRADAGYHMDFPARNARRIEPPEGLAEALGAQPVEVWGESVLCAVMPDEETVRALKPDTGKILRVASSAVERGNVIVAACADEGRPYDVVSRFFAPGSGIPEDPATGAAHCLLTPLFAAKLGRTRLRCHQAYPGRGGDLDCELKGERVILAGQAVTVLEGRLRVEPAAAR